MTWSLKDAKITNKVLSDKKTLGSYDTFSGAAVFSLRVAFSIEP
jgi:hypothetical protein